MHQAQCFSQRVSDVQILNYIPNFGSMIAMFLPVPILIVDACEDGNTEHCLGPIQQSLAFIIPAIIQGIIGNAVEPSLFGKSLNLTAISVLGALVLWGSVWGVQGAILSVPLLAVTKLLLDAADYPLAKQALNLIREDNAIEEALEMQSSHKGRKSSHSTSPGHTHHKHGGQHHLYAGTYQQQTEHKEHHQQQLLEQQMRDYPHLRERVHTTPAGLTMHPSEGQLTPEMTPVLSGAPAQQQMSERSAIVTPRGRSPPPFDTQSAAPRSSTPVRERSV